MNGREVKPGGASLTDAVGTPAPAPDRPGATTLVEREGQRTQPVPAALRTRVERATGTNLGDVRIHTGPDANAKAEAHGARALTIGQNIFVRDGEAIDEGSELIAHEVAHTVQNAKSGGSTGGGTTSPDDAGEKEARQFASAVAEGGTPAPIVESLGGKIARDALIPANDLPKKKPDDKFSGPVTWGVIGDNFEVRLHRQDGELVTDITYLGTYPVDSYQMPGKADPTRTQRIKTRRRTPPDNRKDLAYETKLLARSSNQLMFDLFGDGVELLVIRDEYDPDYIAKFDRRTHLMHVAVNGFPMDPAWFEVHLPTGDGKGGAEGDREAIAQRKIKLLKDEFTLRTRRHGDAEEVVLGIVNAVGEQQVIVPIPGIGSKRLGIELLKNDGRTLEIDLDCDGKPDAVLVHTMRQFPPPGVGGRYRGGHLSMSRMADMDMDFAREQEPHYVHEVTTYSAGGVQLGRMIQKMPGYPGAIPPQQDAVANPPPAGAAQPDGAAPKDEALLPGQVPEAHQSTGRDWELRLDGDGDRSSELLLHFVPIKPFTEIAPQDYYSMRITQLSSGITHVANLNLMTGHAKSLDQHGPQLLQASDGHTPGLIELGRDMGPKMSFGVPHHATSAFGQPLPNAAPPEGHTRYEFTMNGSPTIVFDPPTETKGTQPLAADEENAMSTKKVAGALTTDIGLTEYNDQFRITVQDAGYNHILLGVSALRDGSPVGGIHTRLENVEGPRLDRVKSATNRVSFLVDPKSAVETLDIVSALDPPKDPKGELIEGIPPTSHRDHRITLFGKGLHGDLSETFPVRDGKFVAKGWEKDKKNSDAALASGSADAVGVLQEQAKHPSVTELKIQIDAGLDRAVSDAVEKKYITERQASVWSELRTSMIMIEAQASADHEPSSTQVETAEKSVKDLDDWLEMETMQAYNDGLTSFDLRATSRRRTAPGTPGPGEVYSGTAVNPYTGQKFAMKDSVLGEEKDNSTTYGQLVKGDLHGKEWSQAGIHYNKFRDGVRRWLKSRYERDTKQGEQSAGAAQLEYLGKMAEETGKLDKIQSERLALDNSIDAEVLKAASKGVIRQDLGATWTQLREEMLLLTAQTSGEQPDKDLTARGATHANAIASWLAAETSDRTWSAGAAKANGYTGETQLKVGDEWATSSAGYGAKLAEQLQAGQMQQAGQVYNRLRDGVVRWIVKKYESDPKYLDPFAAARLGGLQKERKSKRDVIRIPAIYQADESFEKMPDGEGYKKEDFGKYKTVPLTVFVWAEDNKWHIRDVTNPERVWNPDTIDFNDEDQPPEELFKKLDHSRHLPKGHITYQLPDGTGNRIRLESEKPWYDYCKQWATYIGLAALGVMVAAGTFGVGAAVALPVMMAFTASAALSIAGAVGELHDAFKEGFADSELVYANVLDIAANLIGLGAGVAGKLAMGAEAAALAESQGTGAAWTGFRAFAGKAGSMAYRPLMAANYMNNALNAIMMSDVALGELMEVEKIEDPVARLKAFGSILLRWAVTGGVAIMSLRGDLPSFTKGAPKITLDNINGRTVARVADVHIGKTVVELPHANNANEHASARWDAEELEHTAKTGKGDAKEGATAALTEKEFQEWYAKWLENPKRIGPDGKVIVPEGTPHNFQERAQAIANRSDAKLRQQAFETADEVARVREAAAEDGLDINPNRDTWQSTREKLEKKLEADWGKERTRKALDRYEAARRGTEGDPAEYVSQRAKVAQVLPDSEIERLKSLYPGSELHVTGDLTAKQAAPGKGPDAVEAVVVVANDTPPDRMSALEQRANGYQAIPDPEYTKATGKQSLGLRVKVMTEDQFFGMATASQKGKAAPTYVRVDQSISDAIDTGVPTRQESATHYTVEPGDITTARAKMTDESKGGGRVGKLQYDPETNSIYFEVRGGKAGGRIRVQAALPPKVTTAADLAHPNRIIGEPVKPGDAMDIMRRLNDGDFTALERTGVQGHGAEHVIDEGTEFGLGELPNGDLVVIRGQFGAVDWTNFPGVKPLAHTHPKMNLQGVDHISVAELGTPEKAGDAPSYNRAVVYPTAEDLAVILARKVKEHTVVTSFHVRDGIVFKPDATMGTGKPLDFVIRNVEEVGKLPSGERVYKATITGVAGGETVIPARETWGAVDPAGHASFIDLREPTNMIPSRAEVPTAGAKVTEPSTTRAAVDKATVESIAREEIDRQGIKAKVEIQDPLPPQDFKNRFDSAKGKAVFVLEPDGKGKIYTSEDARPIDVRAEVQHVKQMEDPAMAGEIRRLHGPDLEKNWDHMAAADRLEHFRRKLNIEIDAHQSMLEDLQGKDRKEIAGQLQDLRQLQKRAEALTPKELAEMNAGLRPMEPYLKEPAWLFSKKRGPRGDAHADAVTTHPKDEKGMLLPRDGLERSAAYTSLDNVDTVHQLGTEWQENWQITSGYEGRCTSVAPNADGGTTVQITDKTGGVHAYDLEPGARVLVEVDPDVQINRGTPLGNDPARRYRYVEITFKEKGGATRVERREEIRSSKDDGSWVQRGSESTNRGKAMEKAARAQADEQLAARKKAADAKGQYFESKRLEYPQGSGGFDDTLVQFTGSPEKPKARLRVREVKDYPDRHVPLADFTAILPPEKGGNLKANMKALERQVTTEIEKLNDNIDAQPGGTFSGLTREQVFAIEAALKKNQIDFEVVLGPDTLIGREGARGSSVIDSLRNELKNYFEGTDVLKRQGGKYSPERVSQENADKFKPLGGAAKPDPDEP